MKYIEIQRIIAPEALGIIQRRYALLRAVAHLAPVGRRVLATSLHIGERAVRSELDNLKHLGLIDSGGGGVTLTPRGQDLLREITPYSLGLFGLQDLERQVTSRLGAQQVLIVPGDSSEDDLVKKELGWTAARLLTQKLRDGDIIAVTGGSTIASVAESNFAEKFEVTVVPGRGALGEKVEMQANTIAAKLAQALSGDYRLLHAPDNLSPLALDELARESGIAQVLALIRKTTILLHGIGDALEMAQRRNVARQQVENLKELNAVAEMLGYYFNAQGQKVWQAQSIGLHLADLENINTVIAVAGGSAKAEAIKAVAAYRNNFILITDQGAAEQLMNLPPI